MSKVKVWGAAALIAAIWIGVGAASAQVQTEVPPVVPGVQPVTVEHIEVHGASLEGNLEGEAVDRDVIVFLPPGYFKHKHKRYPVVYALHGFSIGAEQWTHEIHVPQTIEGAFALGAKQMIVVLPDSKTVYGGSMYSRSQTTGDFEEFIWKAQLASAAAWSPDPQKPPLYLDLPVKGAVVQQDILEKWEANSPLAFIDQYIDNLRRYRAIAIDVGDEDGLRFDTIKVHDTLDNYGVKSSFEIYHGTHTSAVADRFQNHVLPFFSRNLCFTTNCR